MKVTEIPLIRDGESWRISGWPVFCVQGIAKEFPMTRSANQLWIVFHDVPHKDRIPVKRDAYGLWATRPYSRRGWYALPFDIRVRLPREYNELHAEVWYA